MLSRLFVLVAVAILPLIAIQAHSEIALRRSREVEVQNHAASLARLSAAEQQQIVQEIRQVLIAMSELPSIKARDSDACNAYLAALHTRFPAFITFLITDLNGASFCDTNSDHRPISIAARAYFASILKTGAFTAGEFSAGLSTGRRVVQFALPFYGDNDRMSGVMSQAQPGLARGLHRSKRRPARSRACHHGPQRYLPRPLPRQWAVRRQTMPGEEYLNRRCSRRRWGGADRSLLGVAG